MCGIAGIFDFRNKIVRNELKSLSEKLQFRGPDAEGIWINQTENLGLVHRRLSILDLNERSNQPMQQKNFTITYNGEVYNYNELKKNHFSFNTNWLTTSDTEVLLKLYDLFKHRTPTYLRGMFAFAIYDQNQDELFLARDHFGMKPLYYSFINDKFIFSSNLNSLVSLLPNKNLNNQSLYSFFRLGHVEEPGTIYKDIYMLPAGHSITVSKKGIKIDSFFNLNTYEAKVDTNFIETFKDSIDHHLISDEKIILFLSSGLDSSLIGSIINSKGLKNINSVTLSYNRPYLNDEGEDAKMVANILNLPHEIAKIGEEDFDQHLDRILSCMDQPSIDGINTYFISNVANKLGYKVALSGLGGDELFGGYETFKYMKLFPILQKTPNIGLSLFKQINKKIKLFPLEKANEISNFLSNFNSFYFYIRSFMPNLLISQILDPDIYKTGKKDFEQWVDSLYFDQQKTIFRSTSDLELNHYMKNQLLRDNDWASMANSVELRVPFVDLKMLDYQRTISANKNIQKKDFYKKNYPSLPLELYQLKKKGFGIPVPEWIKTKTKNNDASSDLKTWAQFIIKKKIDEKIIQN